MSEIVDSTVRRAVYASFCAGTVPTRAAVERITGLDDESIAASYQRLAAGHVLVLQPASGEIWMAMPFSAIPTPFVVTSGELRWWANCAWDALGIGAATGHDIEISTQCPDCADPLGIAVRGGELVGEGVVHFAVPAAHWWDDVGFT